MQDMIDEIKELIITTLELEEVGPADIDSREPLFGDGFGLDSIDALEIGVELQKRYGLKLDQATKEVRHHFYSVESLAKFVFDNRPSQASTGQ